MLEGRVPILYQLGEEALQIPLYGGIGVFLDDQGSGGVAAENGEQALVEAAGGDEVVGLSGEFVKPPAPGCDVDACQGLGHGAGLSQRQR